VLRPDKQYALPYVMDCTQEGKQPPGDAKHHTTQSTQAAHEILGEAIFPLGNIGTEVDGGY
jgi:hypothetical protein